MSKPKCKQDFCKALLYTILGQPGQTGDTTSCLEILAPSPQELQVSEGLCAHTKSFLTLSETYVDTSSLFLARFAFVAWLMPHQPFWPQWCQ